jgi:hypothetical protein
MVLKTFPQNMAKIFAFFAQTTTASLKKKIAHNIGF